MMVDDALRNAVMKRFTPVSDSRKAESQKQPTRHVSNERLKEIEYERLGLIKERIPQVPPEKIEQKVKVEESSTPKPSASLEKALEETLKRQTETPKEKEVSQEERSRAFECSSTDLMKDLVRQFHP
jgi:hypothetical protein